MSDLIICDRRPRLVWNVEVLLQRESGRTKPAMLFRRPTTYTRARRALAEQRALGRAARLVQVQPVAPATRARGARRATNPRQRELF